MVLNLSSTIRLIKLAKRLLRTHNQNNIEKGEKLTLVSDMKGISCGVPVLVAQKMFDFVQVLLLET